MEILPAILPKSFEELKEKLAILGDEKITVQVDACDGEFTPEKSWPFSVKNPPLSQRIAATTNAAHANFGEEAGGRENGNGFDDSFLKIVSGETRMPGGKNLKYEFDLMMRFPAEALDSFASAGASSIIVHRKSISNLEDFKAIMKIISGPTGFWGRLFPKKIKFGAGFELGADRVEVRAFAEAADFIQFMGIEKIGFQGQIFDERVVENVRELRRRVPSAKIGVDGGINLENAKKLADAGANRLTVGSAIWRSENPMAELKKFQEIGS